ncbi:LAME_0G14994g1_1 [Lachancea meyersii CBS 8951]|uniref:RING-type E3 ubiquitin transferase n=1 Tax=Lachancea meyersii CBS 8951 TaxID=1266667 RepID=A0A1G4KAK7_9SACH|nr:LAME_0G14994g1_1 [Lachancea meyersii CBS 8951]
MEIDGNTVLLLFVFLFILYSNPSGDGVTSQYEYIQLQTLKAQYQDEFAQFGNLSHSSNFRNITGLKLSYGDVLRQPDINATYPIQGKDYDHWFTDQNYTLLPEAVSDQVNNEIWATKHNVFPPNVTSTLRGRVVNSHDGFLPMPMPIPEYYEPAQDLIQNRPSLSEPYVADPGDYTGSHNITFDEGEIVMEIISTDSTSSPLEPEKRFHNSQSDKWRFLHLEIHLSDLAENQKHSISTKAIYDIRNGRILAVSESAKFHSLFALPHYMNLKEEDETIYNEVKTLVEEYWNATDFFNTRTMAYLQNSYAAANSRCEFLAFLQLEPWWGYSKEQIKTIDEELVWPLGRRANLSSLPPINVSSGLIYSPDCGVKLHMNNVSGLRHELQIKKMRNVLLLGALLLASQIYLLLRQMHHTNTPSMVNKISYWGLSLMNLVDGALAIIFFYMTSSFAALFQPLIVCSFACLILASVFEMRYMISVYASQANERNVSLFTLLRRSTDGDERTAPAVILDEASISSSLYRSYIFKTFFSMIVILSMTTWPRSLRVPVESFAVFVLNSYWVPQIVRNAIKGNEPRRGTTGNSSRRNQNKPPLLWSFVIGTSVIRFLPAAYAFSVPSNIFYHHQDRPFVALVALWLIFQMAVLYSQDVVGARWFLPNYTIPDGYGYHKAISAGELLEHGSSENYTIDCAICMTDVAVYVEDIPETHKVDQHEYMVTPCGHIFHTGCLENWLSYKLQCPVCRSPLPPL